MTALAPCPACQHGSHAEHVRDWQPLTPQQIAEGFCGGKVCLCKGDCQPLPVNAEVVKAMRSA